MTEILYNHPSQDAGDVSKVSSSSIRNTPRYEAFLMTGEKMISLDPNISARYAEVFKFFFQFSTLFSYFLQLFFLFFHDFIMIIICDFLKMNYEQLPPTTAKIEVPRYGPFDDFPSYMMRNHVRSRFCPESAVPASQSDNGINNEKILLNASFQNFS